MYPYIGAFIFVFFFQKIEISKFDSYIDNASREASFINLKFQLQPIGTAFPHI